MVTAIDLTNNGGNSNLAINNTGSTGAVEFDAGTATITINNSGTIAPVRDPVSFGIGGAVRVENAMRSNGDGPALVINNSGTINDVIFSSAEGTASTLSIFNTGVFSTTIQSNSRSDFQYSVLPENGDLVVNLGAMRGSVSFGNLSDTYIGHDGTVIGQVTGGFGHDTLIGGTGDEILRGEGDNDYLQGNGGDDVLDGGDGFDTVGLSGSAADYTFTRNEDGSVSASGMSGNDQLIAIEQVDFLDDNEDAFDLEWLLEGVGGGDGEDNEFADIPGETQCLKAEGDGIFVISAPVAGYAWDVSQDGQGIVVWNTADNSFDVLYGFSTLRFADSEFPLGGTQETGSRVEDNPDETQYLTGTAGHDTFVIDAPVAGHAWDRTQDGEGIVVWDTADNSFDILYGFEELEFDDSEFSI